MKRRSFIAVAVGSVLAQFTEKKPAAAELPEPEIMPPVVGTKGKSDLEMEWWHNVPVWDFLR